VEVGGLRGLKRIEFPLLVRKKAFVRCCRDGVLRQRGLVAVHASKTMTRAYHAEAAELMHQQLDIICPSADDVISAVVIVHLVRTSPNLWFFASFGFVLRSPKRYSFRSCAGALGSFNWKRP
jgi:hypothetical protein